MHLDHYEGLHSHWNYGTIYCSAISKRLLLAKFDINPKIIVELEIDQTIAIFLDPQKHVSINVTAIDANHCAGSVMLLFEGYFGFVLCTGDFRYHRFMRENEHLFRRKIDKLYLDNTFFDPRFQIPSQEEAIQQIVQLFEIIRITM